LILFIISALRLLVGWKEGHRACKQLRGGVVLASVKSRLVLPFWYRLTRVVPEKGPLNVCAGVCVFNEVITFFLMYCAVLGLPFDLVMHSFGQLVDSPSFFAIVLYM